MTGLLRLYPESPIIRCDYDDVNRIIHPFGFRLMRPYTPMQRKDAAWDISLSSGLHRFMRDTSIVFFTVYHSMSNLYVHNSGLVECESIYDHGIDSTVRYINKFNDAPFYPNAKRIKVALLPTYQPLSFVPVEPTYLLYFPENDMMFDGKRHYQRTIESVTPVEIFDKRGQYRQLLKEE